MFVRPDFAQGPSPHMAIARVHAWLHQCKEIKISQSNRLLIHVTLQYIIGY